VECDDRLGAKFGVWWTDMKIEKSCRFAEMLYENKRAMYKALFLFTLIRFFRKFTLTTIRSAGFSGSAILSGSGYAKRPLLLRSPAPGALEQGSEEHNTISLRL